MEVKDYPTAFQCRERIQGIAEKLRRVSFIRLFEATYDDRFDLDLKARCVYDKICFQMFQRIVME